MKLRNLKKERGITLIALVVTIVVLLILAGVSISMVLGNNGLISKAKDAKEKTEQDQVNTETGMNNLYDEMIGILGENDGNAGNGEDSGSGNTGNGENGGSTEGGEGINWDDILADANANPDSYKHEETLTSEYIAIGTDGQPVNMDLWNPTKLEDGTFLLGTTSNWYTTTNAYVGSYDGGVIEGMVPQYIYNTDTKTFEPVVKMRSTFAFSALKIAPEIPDTVTDISFLFSYCESLTKAPEIPSGVTDMNATFWKCMSLTEAPEIPSSVTSMDSTFYYCTNLTEAPEIPSSVTNMYWTFEYCTSLTKAPPEIPSSVTNMESTFNGCTSLTGTITINANPTSYSGCFRSTIQPITLTNSATAEETATSTTLNNLKGTATNGNVTVVPAK